MWWVIKSANSKYGNFIEEAKFIFGQNKKPHIILSIDILGRRFEEVHYYKYFNKKYFYKKISIDYNIL